MVSQVTPAENAGIVAGKCRSHLHALMAVNAVKLVFVAAAFTSQVAFSPVACLDSCMIANNFILLLLEH